ncbi:hypothetical protein ACFPIJ_43515 [Dactylosporangium cerinum]|uniref:Uncharacterized protein n=1 Tax=Dactylosporangium cerinum TaxID=1434730 RepID=A0ABV9WBK6_9ACTN
MAETFAEELGGPPTVEEVMGILELAGIGGSGVGLRYTTNIRAAPGASRVGDLNDATFVAASDGLDVVIGPDTDPDGPGFAAEVGRRLTVALREAGIAYADVDSGRDVQVTATVVRRSKRIRVGDVVAAPVEAGGYRIGVLVANDVFGVAIGFFTAVVPGPRLPAVTAEVVPYPMYLADRSVESGQWPVIGHDERLLGLFPREPEIYHRPDWPAKQRRGEFGTAETAAGALRKIDAAEARAVGLADGSYHQFLPGPRMLLWLDTHYPPGGGTRDVVGHVS